MLAYSQNTSLQSFSCWFLKGHNVKPLIWVEIVFIIIWENSWEVFDITFSGTQTLVEVSLLITSKLMAL